MSKGAFDFKTASAAQIFQRARELEGLLLGQVAGTPFVATEMARGKGEVGRAIETFFGIPANPIADADFPAAGVELKVVPLVRSGNNYHVKERTVISMIDYKALVLETWATAHVRQKLHILFVFFEHLPGRPKSDFPVRKVLLWKPEGQVADLIREDWYRVLRKVKDGQAHELSEADGRIMGPCTKGVDSAHLRRQPFNSTLAKSRAFALKPPFTLSLYLEATGRLGQVESLITNLRLRRLDMFEDQLLDRVRPHIGRTIGELGNRLGVPRSARKDYAAQVVRRLFGARSYRSKIKEFEESGLTLRITRVAPDGLPYEHLSFPAFRYSELLEETWDDSDLLSRIEYMLLVPVLGTERDTPQADCRLGEPIFWRPTMEELETVQQEWEMFRNEIRRGKARDLTPASRTSIIHVRPHSRDAQDTDEAPLVGQIVKKSFWLNRGFVAEIVRGAA
jgi:DNA mismatch repair protein MutH